MLYSTHALTRINQLTRKPAQWFSDLYAEEKYVTLGEDARKCLHHLFYIKDEDKFLVFVVGEEVVTTLALKDHQGLHSQHRMVIDPEVLGRCKMLYSEVDQFAHWGKTNKYRVNLRCPMGKSFMSFDIHPDSIFKKENSEASCLEYATKALELKREMVEKVMIHYPECHAVLSSNKQKLLWFKLGTKVSIHKEDS